MKKLFLLGCFALTSGFFGNTGKREFVRETIPAKFSFVGSVSVKESRAEGDVSVVGKVDVAEGFQVAGDLSVVGTLKGKGLVVKGSTSVVGLVDLVSAKLGDVTVVSEKSVFVDCDLANLTVEPSDSGKPSVVVLRKTKVKQVEFKTTPGVVESDDPKVVVVNGVLKKI